MIRNPASIRLGRLRHAALLLFTVVAPLVCAAADPYPNRALRIVVSFPPGTTTDTLARTVERLISIGMVPEASTPQELATNIRAEVARWGPIIGAAGISQE